MEIRAIQLSCNISEMCASALYGLTSEQIRARSIEG